MNHAAETGCTCVCAMRVDDLRGLPSGYRIAFCDVCNFQAATAACDCTWGNPGEPPAVRRTLSKREVIALTRAQERLSALGLMLDAMLPSLHASALWHIRRQVEEALWLCRAESSGMALVCPLCRRALSADPRRAVTGDLGQPRRD